MEYFAISMTNLEEVFLKLGEIEDAHQLHNSSPSMIDITFKRESINQSAQTILEVVGSKFRTKGQ